MTAVTHAAGTLLRTAGSDDIEFLWVVLHEAAFWRPDAERLPLEEVRLAPELARYVEGFGRRGDWGVIAQEARQPLGAAWWRHFPSAAPGYGFVDEATPELTLAVLADHRGRGIGTALLAALERAARRRGLAGLSLSVERDNPALALYERHGFQRAGGLGGSLTMIRHLSQGTRPASR